MQRLARAKKKTIGFKQSAKAVEKGLAGMVFVAKDADDKVRTPILELCYKKGIPVVEAQTMTELGRVSGIQVGTAVAAILKEDE